MGKHCDVVQDCYEDAYQRLRRPVLRRARRWFPSLGGADLEDVYQAAWLSIVRTEASVRDLEDYVYAAVRSQGLMELRRRRRRPVVSLANLGGSRGFFSGDSDVEWGIRGAGRRCGGLGGGSGGDAGDGSVGAGPA